MNLDKDLARTANGCCLHWWHSCLGTEWGRALGKPRTSPTMSSRVRIVAEEREMSVLTFFCGVPRQCRWCWGPTYHKKKVKAIINAPRPKSVKEFQSFLGLVNYYTTLIWNLASISHLLINLLCKDVRWKWTKTCERAFNELKQRLASTVHYVVQLPVKLTCDASSYHIGAIISDVLPNDTKDLQRVQHSRSSGRDHCSGAVPKRTTERTESESVRGNSRYVWRLGSWQTVTSRWESKTRT